MNKTQEDLLKAAITNLEDFIQGWEKNTDGDKEVSLSISIKSENMTRKTVYDFPFSYSECKDKLVKLEQRLRILQLNKRLL